MKKFIVLLLAALLIAGVFVSCKEDPKPEPDALKGTWKGTAADLTEYTMVCDGFGKVTFTEKEYGKDPETHDATYSLDTTNKYVTLNYQDEEDEETRYIFIIPNTPAEGEYAIADSDLPEMPTDPEAFLAPFSKDGNEYDFFHPSSSDKKTAMGYVYDLSSPTGNVTITYYQYEEDYDPDDVPTLLCSMTSSSDFTLTEGTDLDAWDYKLVGGTSLDLSLRAKYSLSADTFTIYDEDGDELELTKQ